MRQKAVDDEDLEGRLKASREKNADLEKKLNIANHQTEVQEKNTKEHIKEIVSRKTENYKSSKNV